MTCTTIRRLLGTVIALVAIMAVAIPAAADGPTKAPIINTPGELDGFCSFPINVTFPVNDETMKTFYDSAGNPVRTLNDGRLVVTFTNMTTGKTVTENLSGPGQILYNVPAGSNTITFLGNSGVFIQGASGPMLLLTSGKVVVVAATLTSLGSLVSAVGRETNICSLLS